MYCPRCGQEQISNAMRFCSRCGLSMIGLAEWLAASYVPDLPQTGKQVDVNSPRRKGIRRGLKLLFLSAVLFPVFLTISIAVDDGAPMSIPFLLFFASLMIMLYARLFSETSTTVPLPAQPSNLGAMSDRNALPPGSNIPIYGPGHPAGQQARTNELAQPPSVTEHTTKLLDSE